jgi:hypothetical protein
MWLLFFPNTISSIEDNFYKGFSEAKRMSLISASFSFSVLLLAFVTEPKSFFGTFYLPLGVGSSQL